MSRFLFIRDGGLGDCLLVLPLVESLRAARPQAEIAFMAPGRYCRVIGLSSARPEAIPIERAVRPELFGSDPPPEALAPFDGWDRIYSFHGGESLASVLSRRSPIRYLDPRPGDGYIVHHLAQILRADGIELSIDFPTLLPNRAASDPSVFYVHPGGGTGKKRWAPGNYAPMLERIRRSHPRSRAVLLIGEAEIDLLELLRDHFDEVVEQPSLDLLPSMLAGRPYLGMDSGPTHLAAASGASVLALFGPTDPRVWAQPRDNYHILTDLEHLQSVTVSDRMTELIENAQSN